MTSNDLYSTKSLERQITNRKTDLNKEKVQWLKIQWLNYKKEQPFNFNYKYSNDTDYPFYCNYIGKRNSNVQKYTENLDLLYPNGHTISKKKKRFD